VTGLRQMFDEVAGAPGAPGPPSRLSAEQVYAAGRRRRTRNGVVKGLTAVIAVLAGVGVGGALAASGGGADSAPADKAVPRHTVSGPIRRVAAAGADHLYFTYAACPTPGESCPKIRERLFGSDDGGRTWQERDPAFDAHDLRVLGPQTLVAIGVRTAIKISTTGGRTWSDARRENTPVISLPAGGGVVCWAADSDATPCTLHAIDPTSGLFAPLASRPPLKPEVGFVDLVAGHLWVGGHHPTAAGRQGVAVSSDSGRTWQTRFLPDPPTCAPDPCPLPTLATSGDGATAYAVVRYDGKRERRVYRITAGGLPERTGGAGQVPYSDAGDGSFVTADGTHVLAQNVSGERVDESRWWAATKSTYQPIDLDGLPATAHSVRRAADGLFYASSYASDEGFYRSADGRHWSPVSTPGR
jgi:hypothetical protein